MFRKLGWAAFLASVTYAGVFAPVATANISRPIYACFSPENAVAIGRLGASDGSVRYGFETGECLALPPGVPLNDVERQGTLWRFRVFGARPLLYAADWGAGFQPASPPGPQGFERYLPVTAALLANGRAYAQCYDESERLSARIDNHERRWRDYQSWGKPKDDSASPKIVIYVGDTGPRLAAEAQQLRQESAKLDQRCGRVAEMEADDDFVAFVRTAQQA